MFTMGTDFKYQYAESWFRNMDKLIHYVNKVRMYRSITTELNTCSVIFESFIIGHGICISVEPFS